MAASDQSGRDRAHIKYCRDDQCVIEYPDPGKDCLNFDYILDRVEREAGDREGLTGEARRERFISYGEVSLVCQECDTTITMGSVDPPLPVLVEAARDHTCDLARVEKVKASEGEHAVAQR